MQRLSALIVIGVCLATGDLALAAPKPHVISFGKWALAKIPDTDGDKTADVKVRAIFIDSRLKEYSTGLPHDVTERLFVVRRIVRVNDALPQETQSHWQWQWDGWLLVDRLTGRVTQLNLPDFDPEFSVASWYRDYVGYCGRSEDGKTVYAVVAQLGRRKAILRKALTPSAVTSVAPCISLVWRRNPAQVIFQPDNGQQLNFSIRGRAVEIIEDSEGDAEE